MQNMLRAYRYKIIQFLNRILLKKRIVLTPTLYGYEKEFGKLLSPFSQDYIRYAMWYLIAEKINQEKISGSIAEAGVYRGGSAALLNILFSERKLFLFDTFKGFDHKDLELDKGKAYSEGKKEFTMTSENIVLAKMKHPDMCIVKKGRFPESAVNIDDNFVFVSIDFDLYEPTLKALEFFYDKLVPKGIIFVHDYNHKKFKGIKSAVSEFCDKNKITFIPIPDTAGSVLIVK